MISFSGIDCSGKSTQIELIKKHYEKQNRKCVVIWSRGGYTPGINFLKKLIRRNSGKTKEEIISESNRVNENKSKRKFLFMIGLWDLWRYYTFSLRFKEMTGKVVICDRYIWDTYIDYKIKYPEYDFKKFFIWKLTLKTMLKPKHSFCLTISAEESMRRSTLKEEPFPETVEARKKRIEHYYHEIENNRWKTVIDAEKSIDEVFAEIEKCL